jgi:endo-1,4-beta-mannosidase
MKSSFSILLLLLSFTLNCTGKDDFVQRQGTKFILNGKAFYVVGTNNYYLNFKPNNMIDDVINDAAAMDLKVIRCWGFCDGEVKDGIVMQPQLGIYDESGFERLDYTIFQAGQKNLKIVLPLVNNWNPFGGMNQYVQWTGGGSHDDFYIRPAIKDAFKKYIHYMLNRTNSYSKIQYKNDPTIMTWELANEPRCQSDTTGDTLINWADEMSSYIKSLDPNHLVALGDEGFYNRTGQGNDWMRNGTEGVDWDRLLTLKNLDYGTFRLYIENWSKNIDWGRQWIIEHIQEAHSAGKPCVLEEFGYTNQALRDSAYTLWLNTIYENNGNGDIFWILTGIQEDSTDYPDHDGFRVLHPSSTAKVISEHAQKMNEKSRE